MLKFQWRKSFISKGWVGGSDHNENVSFLHLPQSSYYQNYQNLVSTAGPAGKFWTAGKFQAQSACEAWREGLAALLVVFWNNCHRDHWWRQGVKTPFSGWGGLENPKLSISTWDQFQLWDVMFCDKTTCHTMFSIFCSIFGQSQGKTINFGKFRFLSIFLSKSFSIFYRFPLFPTMWWWWWWQWWSHLNGQDTPRQIGYGPTFDIFGACSL